jgi:hypothetical protein
VTPYQRLPCRDALFSDALIFDDHSSDACEGLQIRGGVGVEMGVGARGVMRGGWNGGLR